MFTEEAPSFEGRYYRIHEARNVPPPVQGGGPPILVGGGGEQRTLQLVARYADMCNIVGDPATVAHKVDVLRGHCKAIGRDPAEITVSRLSTLVLTANDEETTATKEFLRQVTGEEPSGSDVGTVDELDARVEELAAAGVDYFVFNMPTGTAETVRQVGESLVGRFPRLNGWRRLATRPAGAARSCVRGRQTAGDHGDEDRQRESKAPRSRRPSRPGRSAQGTALISEAKRFHSTRPRAIADGDPDGAPDDGGDARLHSHSDGELSPGEAERLQDGQVVPSAPHRRHERDAERHGGADRQSDPEEEGCRPEGPVVQDLGRAEHPEHRAAVDGDVHPAPDGLQGGQRGGAGCPPLCERGWRWVRASHGRGCVPRPG